MGDADIAVHSLKDVPADLNDEFQIVATLERANPSDSIIFKESITLDQLKINQLSQPHLLDVQHKSNYSILLWKCVQLEAIFIQE